MEVLLWGILEKVNICSNEALWRLHIFIQKIFEINLKILGSESFTGWLRSLGYKVDQTTADTLVPGHGCSASLCQPQMLSHLVANTETCPLMLLHLTADVVPAMDTLTPWMRSCLATDALHQVADALMSGCRCSLTRLQECKGMPECARMMFYCPHLSS